MAWCSARSADNRLRPPGGTCVLTLHAHRHGAPLDVPGLVYHQDRAGIGEVLQHIAAQVIPHPGLVPGRGRQEPLHSPRPGFPGVLGDRPAVHPRPPGQQAPHERRRPPPRLHPAEPAANAQHQLIEFPPPAIQVYAEASGHRSVFCCPHTFGSSGGGRITSTVTRRAVTKCRWRIKRQCHELGLFGVVRGHGGLSGPTRLALTDLRILAATLTTDNIRGRFPGRYQNMASSV
jgi:hypothetical protein